MIERAPSIPVRRMAWALTVGLGLVASGIAPALGACAPDPAASGGTVTCTGTDSNGFNAGSANSLTLTVDPGATVSNSGTSPALNLTSGNDVTVAGSVASTRDGLRLTTGNAIELLSDGGIASGQIGISLSGAGNDIINSGSIVTSGSSGNDGIRASANGTDIANETGGSITAVLDGIDVRSGTALLLQQIVNDGAIAAQVGIRALDFTQIDNAGQITAGSDAIIIRASNLLTNEAGGAIASGRIGISASGSNNLILNEGAITTSGAAGDDGIRVSANSNTITNAATGMIDARLDGIDARSGTATTVQSLTNDGTILAGQVGIRTQNFNLVTNTGQIAAGLDAVEIRADGSVVNSGSLDAGRIGVSVIGSRTTILNSGSIVTGGPSGDDGIRASVDRTSIDNSGTISARIDGIDIRSGTVTARQRIGNAGTIDAGADGVRAIDFTDVANDGAISAGQDGIELRSNGAVVNGAGGSITAAGNGVRLTGSSNSVVNQGDIASTASAGLAITGSGTNTVTNSGSISGVTFSILGGNGGDLIASSGTLDGNVSLGNGADRLDLASGAVLEGDADGGAGADALTLDGAGTLDGAVTRFETLTKTGAGTWRLTGGPSSIAATTVAGGELAVDGSLASQVTVLSGATLSGTGTIGGDVASTGGTVAPGGPTGTLTVSGDYASDAGSTLRVAIDDAGGGSLLSVGGAAVLDGRLEIDPAPGAYGGQVYDLVIAAAGVTGQFADTVVTQPLRYLLEYLADRVRLIALRNDFAALAESDNQRSVGGYLDSLAPAPGSDLATVLAELSALPAAEVPDALDSLHPELYSAYDAVSIAATRRLFSAAEGRLAGIGELLSDQPTPAAGTQLAAATPYGEETLSAEWIAAAPLDSAWIAASAGSIDQDDTDEHLGYEARSFDFVGGADVMLTERSLVGLALSASATSIDWDDDGSTGEVYGLAGALYGAHVTSRARLGAMVGYGHDRYDTDRVIEFGGIDREARGRHDSDRLFASLSGAHALLRQWGWAADASAGLSFIRLDVEEYEETGAGALNLEVEERKQSSLRSEIGVTLSRTLTVDRTTEARPHLSLGWAHEFLEDGAQIDSAFGGLGATFAVEGADEPKDRLLIGAGVTLEQSDGLAVTLGYRGEIGDERTDNAVRLDAVLRF